MREATTKFNLPARFKNRRCESSDPGQEANLRLASALTGFGCELQPKQHVTPPMSGGLIFNSLIVSLGGCVLALLIGASISLWIQTLGGLSRKVLRLFVVLSLALPPFLSPNAWMDLLSVGVTGGSVSVVTTPLGSLSAAILLMGGQTWPIACLLFSSLWTRIPRELYESEPALEGFGFLRHIIWPEVRTTIPLIAVIITLLNLNQFTIPSLLQIKVLLADVWTQYSTHLSAIRALAVAWPLIAIPSALIWLVQRGNSSAIESLDTLPRHQFAKQLGKGWSIAFSLVAILALSGSCGIPLSSLIRKASVWNDLLPAFNGARTAWLSSLLYASATATILLVASIMVQSSYLRYFTKASADRSREGRIFRGIGYGTWLLFFIPGLLMSIGLLTLFSASDGLRWVKNSSVLTVLGFVLRYSAIAWHGTRTSIRRLNQDLLESTAMAGGSMWEVLKGFLIPALLPRLFATWYAIYVLTLWDIEIPLLLQAPGGETLALRIFNLLHYGHNAHVNALCLHMLLLALLPGIGWLLSRLITRGRSAIGRTAAALCCVVAVVSVGCSPDPKAEPTRTHRSLFTRVEILGTRGTGAGEFNKPRSLTVDRQDDLYVVDMTGRVQKFSPDGRFLLMWQLPQTDLGKPKGMTCDANGNLIVVEPHYQRVNHFSPQGKLLHQWGVPGTAPGQLTLPRSVACNSLGWVFLTEYTTVDRVQAFIVPEGAAQLLFGRPGSGPGEFSRAESVHIDSADRIYVADSCNHRIQVFSPKGEFLRTYGRPGSSSGEMSYPYDITTDRQARQYVCEFGNSRIQIFDAQDRSIETLGGYGTETGKLSNPWSIALDSRGNLYVADSGNHRVQKFIAQGGSHK